MILILLGAVVQTSSIYSLGDDNRIQINDEEDDESTTTDNEDDESTSSGDDDESTKTGDNDDDDDEEDSEEEKDEKDDAQERVLTIEMETDSFKVESELKNGDTKDKIKLQFELEDEIEIELKYKSKSEDTETEFKYKVEFEEIIEYLETNGISGYQTNDTDLSRYEFDAWHDLVYQEELIDGVTVLTITATTADNVFTMVMRLSAGLLDLGQAILTPNSLKIDIIIENFDYVQHNSSLALKTKIKTEIEVEIKEDDTTVEEALGLASDESQISLASALGNGFFSWAEIALADGTVIDVITSSLEEEDSDEKDEDDDVLGYKSNRKIYFSFEANNATKIFWDPKIGVVSVQANALIQSIEERYGINATGPLSSFGLWLVLIAISLPVISRRIKNKHN